MNASIHAVAKRYRYTGKERDEESGLYYHGARYYMPWLARWTAVDPLESKYAGMSPYNYGFNNPVIFNDPSGMDPYGPPPQENLIEADNTSVSTFDLYQENNSGAPTPDGGRIMFPKGTIITGEVTDGGGYTFSSNQGAANLPVGAVLAFSYDGLEFTASFNASDNSFLGYYSDDNAYSVTYDNSQLPKKLNTQEASSVFLMGLRVARTSAMADGAYVVGDVIGAGAGILFTFAAAAALLDDPYGGLRMSRPYVGPLDIPIAPAIPITTTVPEPPPQENFLYRFDTRSPDEIMKEGGFKAWGENYDLMQHATGISIKNKTSAYISTSKSPTVVMEELWKGRRDGFLYIIKNQTTGIDVNSRLGTSSPFPLQQEVVVPKFIPITDIRFAIPLKK